MTSLLVVGGTSFIGKAIVDDALRLGLTVTTFTRSGNSRPDVESLRGDRRTSNLALKGRRWDAVIDTCAYAPEDVEFLAESFITPRSYTLLSSISVYRDFARVNIREFDKTYSDAARGLDISDSSSYGMRKAAAERAAVSAFNCSTLIVRAGQIVGPDDYLARLPFWIRRAASTTAFLVPGCPDTRVQLLDARDLSAWIVERSIDCTEGVFNATGPSISFGELVESCQRGWPSPGFPVWIPDDILAKHGVTTFSHYPFYLPACDAEHAGFYDVNSGRAFACGLRSRSLSSTIQDTVSWMQRATSGDETVRAKLAGIGAMGLSPLLEAEIIDEYLTSRRKRDTA